MSVQARSRLLAVIFTVVGVIALWIGAEALGATLAAIGRRDGVIAFWSGATRGLPAGVALCAFAVGLSLPVPEGGFGRTPRTKSAKPAARSGIVAVCMALGLACVLLTLVASPIAEAVMGARAHALGYRRCSTIFERPVKRRWALPPANCPADVR